MSADAEDEIFLGYSLRRNGTCDAREGDLGPTWGPFRSCCPKNTRSPIRWICCPDLEDCSPLLIEYEICADPTAKLYYADETEGFFCCTNDTKGFRIASDNYAGCAKSEDMPDTGVTMRAIVQSARPTARPTTISSNTATGTAVSSTSEADTTNAKVKTGAIAGGVVGGVAGVAISIALVWLLLRRRKKQAQASQSTECPPVPVSELSDATRITELSDGNRITELSGQSISELPGSEKPKPPPAELAS